MRFNRGFAWLLGCGLLSSAQAQTVIRDVEVLTADRPEAWAMNYALASTLMTASGGLPSLEPGEWQLFAELGHIPRLSREQQQVGFGGEKAEDLNKSPVFGRARLLLGLPAGWTAELGYTPPLTIDGAKPQDLFAAALGRRLLERDDWNLSARVFGQHGFARGDITCPSEIAGPFDPDTNPFGCVAASDDRITLTYYGVDLTAAWQRDSWHWHATGGVVRSEPEVQIDAEVFTVRDRSRLIARGVLPYLALGGGYQWNPRWSFGAELLHMPLDVQRTPGGRVENDAFTSLRLRIGYAPY